METVCSCVNVPSRTTGMTMEPGGRRSPRKASAGLLLFRRAAGALEVLLVHPGGPFWTNRDEAAWSIPKGELSEGEVPLDAAIREFEEEMGSHVTGEFIALQPCRQAGGKVVFAWAVEANFDPERLKSNTFTMEWPPRSGRQCIYPEIDRAAWFPLDVARQKVVRGQQGLLDELGSRLA